MKILTEKKLKNGETLTVLHWNSAEPAPEKYKNYLLQSMGTDGIKRNFYAIGSWRAYLSDTMDGAYYPDIVDHWFFAEINGEIAGRIWFAYSAKSLRGNFGHVLTEEKFRQRGIMTELLKYCMEEIKRAPVKILTCATGNRFAAASYKKVGFYSVYGTETGVLCYSKERTFLEEAEAVFRPGKMKEVRPGRITDQFDCDKFLAYTPEIHKRTFPHYGGPAAAIEEFRSIYQESLGGRGVVVTALNEAGACCGYAFGILYHGMPIVDFMLHPAYLDDGEKLVSAAITAFREKFGFIPFYMGYETDENKNKVIEKVRSELQTVILAKPFLL